MAHRSHGEGVHLGNNSAAESEPIPLQDLSSTTGQAISGTSTTTPQPQQEDPGGVSWAPAYANADQHTQHNTQRRSRARSIVQAGVGVGRRLSTSVRHSYDRVNDHTPNHPDRRNPFDADADLDPEAAVSSAQMQQGFEDALGISDDGRQRRGSWLPPRSLDDAVPPYLMESDYDNPTTRIASMDIREVDDDDDRAGLTIPENIQPMSGSNLNTPVSPIGRGSRFGSPSARLGDDLEQGMGGQNGGSSINSRGSLSVPSTSPVRRLSTAVQRMSERVVNLGNDSSPMSRKGSQTSVRGRSLSIASPSGHRHVEFEDFDKEEIQSPDEKPTTPLRPRHPSLRRAPPGRYNPLKGKTLGIFGPNNKIRLFLCDLLCHPITEPLILLMIIVQLVFLTVDAAPSVFKDPRSKAWGTSAFDYAILVLFTFYTLEIIARSIVSGFLFNSHDPSANKSLSQTFDRKAKMIFSLGKAELPREDKPSDPEQPSLLRSVTNLQNMGTINPNAASENSVVNRLARRAFLRHSFNRLDFVAVVSYWISLALFLSGIEAEKHIYVFRMMSCLRILRLVGITSGTSVILRSLKKAAPLLANVALLIGFFWLVFAIVGVQSFKSSLRRRCVWEDPEGIQEPFKHEFQFCGGYLNNVTFQPMPWEHKDTRKPGTKSPKGYLCPVQSRCILDDNPYNGTVSFDNIFQSLELVFVIMSSNTFSELIGYTADSDYLIASIFFIIGVVVLAFWLVNLLVAVITTSFQIIREESKNKSAFTENEEENTLEDHEQLRARPTTVQKWYRKTYWGWIIVIVIGLVASMFKSATMSAVRERRIVNAEFVTTILLDIEMGLRFVVNWRRFHLSKRNWVDLMIAIMSTMLLLPPVRNSPAYAWLSIFAILRVYRVVWAVPSTRNLLAKVLGNVSGLFNLLFFVLLLTYLCAIFAVQLVRGDLPEFTDDGEVNPNSFYTIWYAFLGMYSIFSSEGWTAILYGVQSEQSGMGVGWISATFFIGWFILANFIVLNMFIAVIQENFDVSEDEKRMYQVKAFLQRKEIGVQKNFSLRDLFNKKPARNAAAESHKQAFNLLTKGDVVDSFLDDQQQQPRAVARSQPLTQVAEQEANGDLPMWKRRFNRMWGRKAKEPNPFYTDAAPREYGDLALTAMAQEVMVAQEKQKRLQREYLLKYPRYNTSLFIFGPDNPIRKLCQMMVYPSRGHIRFQGAAPATALWVPFSAVVYSAIITMVVLACVTTPLYQKEYFQNHEFKLTNWFVLTDAGFAGLFTIEVVVKIIADGLVSTPNAYLRSAWGVIDSIVLITLWISVISALRDQSDVSRSVGAFKALRALRLLNISGSARDIFQSVILNGGTKIISAAFVSLSLIIPFAIYGVNLFAGKMEACNDTGSGFTDLTDCLGEFASTPYNWEVLAPRVVDSPAMNFDNFGSSLFTLFQIVSQEGWTGLSWSAQMIVGKGKQPIAQSSPANAIFFVAFNLLGAVFVLTLFVSVFMRNYTEQTGVAFLTSEQRSWMELRKLLRQIRPSKRPPVSPNETWKSWCYRQATNKRGAWARFMTCILILHTCLLVVESYPAPELLDQVRDFFFLSFTLVYLANIVVRCIGLSFRQFIRSRWDVFGLFSVSGTFISTVLSVADDNNAVLSRLQKLFLVSIVFLIIPRNDQLDHLFKTAAASFRTIGSLLATWFVLFLVYAIALTQTFGLTKIGPNSSGNLNFRTVPKAMVVLFRMSCGEGWNDIMTDFELKEPFCIKTEEFLDNDCGSEGYARALFISWNIISMYIFVSLFVSLIFESFSYVYQRSGDLSIVTREELRIFKAAWLPFDPDGTGYIAIEQFPRLLARLSGVFSMSIYDEKFTIKNILQECKTDRNGPGIVSGVNLAKLNKYLSELPVRQCQERRHKFNLFYEEVMVMADRELGVAFTSVLLILAHHKIIDDHKSLKLDEFLRRRWRMQRVEDQVKRNTVTDFFLTLYWNKRFKDHQARKAAGLSFAQSFNIVEPISPSVPRVFTEANERTFPSTNPFRARSESETSAPPNPNVPQIHIENPDTPTGSTTNVSYDGTYDRSRSPPFPSPGSARSNPFDSRAGSPTKGHKKAQLSIGSLGSPEVSPPGSRLPSRSASPAQSLGESLPNSPFRSRSGSHISAREVVEEALQGSEWARQIRSVVSQLSPSSGTFPPISGMPGGSRSDSRSSNRSNKSNKSRPSSRDRDRGGSRDGSPHP